MNRSDVTEKPCAHCKQTLPLDAFTLNRKTPTGRDYKCRACASAYARKFRLEHLEMMRARDRARQAHRPDRVNRKRRPRTPKPAMLTIRAVGPASWDYPSPTCQACGTERRTYRYHPDYTRPSVVRWLCARCHDIAEGQRARTA